MTKSADTALSVISEDRPCIHCGYNLRGLASDGRCPECGESISSSLRGNLLKHADADWLDTLHFGVNLKLWNIALLIIIGIAGGILVAIGFPETLVTLGGVVGGALGLWASFVITTQEPRISLQEDTVTLRKVIRSCATAAFAGALLQEIDELSNTGAIVAIAGGILSLGGLVAAFGELLYLRRFAMRIPDEKLAQSTKILMWAIPIAGGCGIIAGIVVALLGVAPPAPGTVVTPGPLPGAVFAVFGCFALLVGGVLFLWYVRLLYKYKYAFKEAAAESRAVGVDSTEQSPQAPQTT